MLAGRIVWGAVRFMQMELFSAKFSMAAFVSGAFLLAWPGIVVQLILIPVIVLALSKANITEENGQTKASRS